MRIDSVTKQPNKQTPLGNNVAEEVLHLPTSVFFLKATVNASELFVEI